ERRVRDLRKGGWIGVSIAWKKKGVFLHEKRKTTSRRLAERKVEKFQKNITKRGAVPETTTKKGKDYPVGPVLLGFFIFVVIGSCKDSFFAIIFPYSTCMDNLSGFFVGKLSGQRPAEVWHKSALLVLRNCEETGLALGFSFLLVL
ncbi:hypothetical protein Goshw_026341, partial [Gossypium schwendimanii]|nr:hypothetical protein [Gossypium schwendimanii]